jgi:hypothetical protein
MHRLFLAWVGMTQQAIERQGYCTIETVKVAFFNLKNCTFSLLVYIQQLHSAWDTLPELLEAVKSASIMYNMHLFKSPAFF